MAHRPLKDRTREHYRKLLDQHLIPAFGAMPLSSITIDDVRGWHSRFGTKTPTVRSHSYGLRRAMLGTAFSLGTGRIGPSRAVSWGFVSRPDQNLRSFGQQSTAYLGGGVSGPRRSVGRRSPGLPEVGAPLTRSGCCPHARLRLAGADPYLSGKANSACRARSPETHPRHKPTPKWD